MDISTLCLRCGLADATEARSAVAAAAAEEVAEEEAEEAEAAEGERVAEPALLPSMGMEADRGTTSPPHLRAHVHTHTETETRDFGSSVLVLAAAARMSGRAARWRESKRWD